MSQHTTPHHRLEILNVLHGLTLDGAAPNPRPISFTKDPRARAAVTNLLDKTLIELKLFDSNLLQHPPARAAIIHKFLSHLVRTNRQSDDAIRSFADDARAAIHIIINNPDLAEAPVSLAAILRHRTAARAATRKPLRLPPDTPPRPVLWTAPDTRFRLEELTHPCHLMQEGHALQHCIDRQYDLALLTAAGLKRGTPAAACCLTYWQLLENRRIRLFSLAGPHGPLVTINYDILRKAIAQLGPAQHTTLNFTDEFFEPLVDAIVFLSRHLFPLHLGRELFHSEPLIRALTRRVSDRSTRRYLYPSRPLNLQ